MDDLNVLKISEYLGEGYVQCKGVVKFSNINVLWMLGSEG